MTPAPDDTAPVDPQPHVVDWLMAGDPGIRWQVMQDLLGSPDAAVRKERARVAVEGWGARLLSLQDDDGRWAGALYSPKWTSTTYTLLLLHRLGLPARHPQAMAGCRQLWDNARFFGGGLNLAVSIRQPETCITGMLVLLAAAFGLDDPRVDETVAWLVGQQLPDGGWNCESIRSGSRHGSFHTSITALEALRAYEIAGDGIPVHAAIDAGQDFFLRHSLYRSHRTGQPVDPAFLRFPFPPQWHFDVLRGLEHFREAGGARDDRLADAVQRVRAARSGDGRWRMYRPYPGRSWFDMESRGPGRWTTLRALRVLTWWTGATHPVAQRGSAQGAIGSQISSATSTTSSGPAVSPAADVRTSPTHTQTTSLSLR